jgi:hypothetical protein
MEPLEEWNVELVLVDSRVAGSACQLAAASPAGSGRNNRGMWSQPHPFSLVRSLQLVCQTAAGKVNGKSQPIAT